MDLALSDAELAFRDEVRAWIGQNLPEGWGRPGFKEPQTFDEKLEFAKGWEKKLAAAGWAGISWPKEPEADDADVAVSIVKSSCGDWLGHLAGEALQIHGGIGYTWEHDMHLYLRRMKSLEAMCGDAPYHRERLGRLIDL
jgi:alkylation response protein AidB-like acyl-CoA dehydrogenase